MRAIAIFLFCLMLGGGAARALSEPPGNISQYLDEYETEFEDYNLESWIVLFVIVAFIFFAIMEKTKSRGRRG